MATNGAWNQQPGEAATPIMLGEHLAEWEKQGELLLLADPTGRELVQLSREEAYLLLSFLLVHFQQEDTLLTVTEQCIEDRKHG
jgi:hypothetical protein